MAGMMGADGPDMTVPKPRPVPTPVSQPFWDGLAAERVSVQRCADCGAWVYYPRWRCPSCLGGHLVWTPVSGRGRIVTFTVTHSPTAPPFADEMPQRLLVVELDEGVRLTSTLVGQGDPVIGAVVQPVFDHGPDGVTLLRYRLA